LTTSLNEPIRTQFRTIDGLSIRLAESEHRNAHALLLTPWLESLFAYEPMWSRLVGEHTHLVAIDLPGSVIPSAAIRCCPCGRWASPSFASPTHSGSRTRMSSAPMLAAGPRSSPRPCIRAGCIASSSEVGARRSRSGWVGVLKDWIQAPDLETFRSVDRRQIVADALTGIERYALPDFVREDYLSSYEGDRFVESMRYVHTYPTDFPVLRLLLPETQTACRPS
jgi:hypothetical protein